ncbi:MAG: right-handed parallel beta-helix repeat-containing protein [Pseudomonadota bacterium]
MNRNPRLTFALLLLALALALAPMTGVAGELCVNPDGGGCETTIQAAIDLASEDDVITVQLPADGRAYREALVIQTPGITLRGAEPVAFGVNSAEDFDLLLDIDWVAERRACPPIQITACGTVADPASCASDVITIDAPNVSIEALTLGFAAASKSVLLMENADGARLDLNCSLSQSALLETDGQVDDTVISRNRVFASDRVNEIEGDRTRVERNLWHNTDGIKVTGEDVVFDLNAIFLMTDLNAIDVIGDNATVTNNSAQAYVDHGIRYAGIGATITGNVLDGATEAYGIRVRVQQDTGLIPAPPSENVTIANNRVSNVNRSGIELLANNSSVTGNHVENVATAREVDDLLGNRQAGIHVLGSDNVIAENTVALSGDMGIKNGDEDEANSADNNRYENNVITQSALTGIMVYSGAGTIIRGNQFLDSSGEGFGATSLATGIVLENNTLLGNRRDICSCAPDVMLANNEFLTGGREQRCVVGVEPTLACITPTVFRDGFEGTDGETVYTYQGNPFQNATGRFDTSDAVSGSFRLAAPLPANQELKDIRTDLVAFEFTDQELTRTLADSLIFSFLVATGADGNVSEWAIELVEAPGFTQADDVRHVILTDSRSSFVAEDSGNIRRCTTFESDDCSGFTTEESGSTIDAPGEWNVDITINRRRD